MIVSVKKVHRTFSSAKPDRLRTREPFVGLRLASSMGAVHFVNLSHYLCGICVSALREKP